MDDAMILIKTIIIIVVSIGAAYLLWNIGVAIMILCVSIWGYRKLPPTARAALDKQTGGSWTKYVWKLFMTELKDQFKK